MVKEIKTSIDPLELESAIEVEPENVPSAMDQWRTLKDYIDMVNNGLSDVKEKIAYLERYLTKQLSVPEDGKRSETISVPGAGSVYKERLVGVDVVDWEAWRKYLVRNEMTAVTRQQNNITPLQDLYDMIMDGTLPMPKSAKFKTYDKLRMRRN